MSTTIDQRVVEMRFDNKNFEHNAAASISTLDKLKQSLNLTGASKGLENVNAAAKKVDFSAMSNAVETVGIKFNAMYSIADQALRNITNSAMNAGKKIASALTIDPIKSGFSEYETQINAIQTILANTSHAGTDINDVNSALDELNLYADKTIYNFTEMTRNIGTFTAAGLGLEESTAAIKGIANLAAVSGSTSAQASNAMYQLSQALANGKVNLQDWNSVVNAGMGGKVFQDALVRTAAAMKGVSEETFRAQNITGSFRESISSRDGGGWLTSDVLSKTLQQFTGDMTEAELAAEGFNEEQIKSIQSMGVTANEAATKVKTVTQLWDTLKESAQSGWTQTWELIVGDFEEARTMLTEVSDVFGKILGDSAERRNSLLSGALDTNWEKLIGKINEAGIETSVFEEKLSSTLKTHGFNVDKIVENHGSLGEAFKKGVVSSKYLRETIDGLNRSLVDLSTIEKELKIGDTGEDVKKIQEALNGLGYDIGKTGVDGILGNATENAIKTFQEASGLTVTGIIDESTISALEKASGNVDGLTDSVGGLIDGITELGGRELLIDSMRNAFKGIVSVIKPIKEAFRSIFPPTTSEQLYSLIESIHKFSKNLTLSKTASENLKRTFKGLFAVVDIVKQAFGAAFRAISPLFGGLDDLGGGILETTASWGDWLVNLNETIKTSGTFTKAADKIKGAIKSIGEFLKPVADGIKEFGNFVSETFTEISNNAEVRLSPLKTLGAALMAVFTGMGKIIQKVSPWIAAAASGIGKVLGSLMDTISSAIQNADYNAIFDVISGGMIASIGLFITKIMKSGSDIVGNASGFLENINDILEGVSDALGDFSNSLKADTLKKIAIAIGILAASLLVLSLIDSDKLALSLVAISTLFAELMGSMNIFTKIIDGKQLKGIAKIAAAMVGLAASLLILSVALKIMSSMSWKEMGVGLISMTVGLGALVGAVNLLPEANVKKAAKAIKTMASAVLILAVAIKIMSTMSWEEMGVGLITMVVGLGALVAATHLLPKGMALKTSAICMMALAASMVVLAAALKIMATMSWEEIGKSLVVLAGSLGILAGAMALMKKALPGAAALLIIAPALIILSGALKIMSSLSWEEIARGLVALGGSLLIISGAMALMKSALPGAAALLVVTAALAILAPVLKLLGSMSWGEIARGLVALAGAFAVIGIAGLLLGPLVPTILGLSAAIALFGVGIAAIGVGIAAIGAGVLMVGAGLTMLAAALAASGGAIVVFVTSIIGLIPFLIEQIGLGIIKFYETLAGGSDAMCEAIKVMLLAAIDALVTVVPALVEGIFVLLDACLQSLVSHTPTIVAALFDFLIGLLNGVAEKLPDLVVAAVNVIMAFFQGVVDALGGIDTDTLLKGIIGVGLLSALMIALSFVAGLIPGAMLGVLGMGAVIAELALVLALIGGLAQIPGLEWLISEGGQFLQTIGTAIGQFVGGIVGGFASGVSSQFPQIGSDLSAFMTNAQPFIEGAKNIDASMMEGVKALAETILILTAADILSGVTSWITGGSSLSDFAAQLVPFGMSMRAYSMAVSGIDANAVVSSANAAKAIAEMANNLPNSGGIVSWFTGENDMATFAEQLVPFGKSMKKYSDAVVGINAEAITASATAAKALSSLAENLPNSGGIVSWFTGDNDMGSFATQLVPFGKGIKEYSDAVVGINLASVNASIIAAKNLVGLINSISNINISGVVSFNTAVSTLGKVSVDGFVNAFSKSSNKLKNVGTNMMESLAKGINSKQSVLRMTAVRIIDMFANTINSKAGILSRSGLALMNALAKGITSQNYKIKSLVGSVVSGSANVIRGYYNSFYSAGSYLVDGLVAGISVNSYKASAQAAAMASAAYQAAKTALDVNSPSKIFRELGYSVPEGFAMGIDKLSGMASKSAVSMSDGAIKSVGNSVSRIAEAINSDIDSQPTIRPILDLSDVSAGAGAINGMFGMRPSVGLMSNVGTISYMMNGIQNGGNNDVVSAIKDLKNTIGNSSGDVYNFDGITYDDGSNISDAVKSLVRAAKVQRRI